MAANALHEPLWPGEQIECATIFFKAKNSVMHKHGKYQQSNDFQF
jgi:hypothetical protein